APGNYSVTIVDNNGCSAIGNTSINSATSITVVTSGTDVSCNNGSDGALAALAFGGSGGFSYSWADGASGEIRTNLVAGTYVVTVTDDNGCSIIDSITINQPDTLKPNISITDASCPGVNDG